MIIKKICVGFVVQTFDTTTNQFLEQEFIAGDEVDYEDAEGTPLDCDKIWPNGDEPYLPYEMKQPEKS